MLLAGGLALAPLPVRAEGGPAPGDAAYLAALRDTDLRLGSIGFRLVTANAALCDRLQPGTGLLVHTLDEYAPPIRPQVAATLGLTGRVGIEAVVPGSPAAQAGVEPGDVVRAIDGRPVADGAAPSKPTRALRDQVDATLAALPPTAPITLALLRAGKPVERVVRPVAACRVRFDLDLSSGYDTSATEVAVVIPSGVLAAFDADEDVAAVVGHEMAHVVLHHDERLSAAHVGGGLLQGLGRNVRYVRQAETQADILSVYLLANAGYSMPGLVDFWQHRARRLTGGALSFLNDRSHPAIADRAATVEKAAADVAQRRERPIVPAILATRARPFDGNWQAILVRAR